MTQFLIRCHFRFKIFCESEQISSCIIHFFPADDFDLWTLSFVFLSFCAIAPPWPNFRITKSDKKKPSLIIIVELFEKLRWNRDWKTSFQTQPRWLHAIHCRFPYRWCMISRETKCCSIPIHYSTLTNICNTTSSTQRERHTYFIFDET